MKKFVRGCEVGLILFATFVGQRASAETISTLWGGVLLIIAVVEIIMYFASKKD